MDPRQFLGCLVMLLSGLSLLRLDRIAFRKIGMVLIWLASGLTVFFVTGSPGLAALMLAAWMFFPLWEVLFILRKLRVPRHRELADARPPWDEFEELPEMTRQLAEAGFRQIDECRLRPAQHEQYYRLFLRDDGLVQATIGYVAQGSIGFHFLAFASDSRDDRHWITWDYPLTYGLVMPPGTALYRALHCESTPELYQAHLDFLSINALAESDLLPSEGTAAAVRARLERTLDQQIDYNVSRGFLAPAAGVDPDTFCYSWRGTLYVAAKVLRDILF